MRFYEGGSENDENQEDKLVAVKRLLDLNKMLDAEQLKNISDTIRLNELISNISTTIVNYLLKYFNFFKHRNSKKSINSS